MGLCVCNESAIKWASRWDSYLQSAEGTSIHWFSIVNSLIIVLFLTGMLGVIFVRTVYRDIARYNQVWPVLHVRALGRSSNFFFFLFFLSLFLHA